jgi:transposase
MAEPYPIELRQRVIEAYEAGEGGYASLAKRFKVGEASVNRWIRRFREYGHVQPRRKGGGNTSDIDLAELEAILVRLRDANAGELTAAYNVGRRGSARRHASSIKRALYRAGYVVKKNASGRWSSCARTSS